jgi:transposase-like protein
LEPRRRAEQALVAVVQEAYYVNGVSTRTVDRLVAQPALQLPATESEEVPT